MLQCRPLQVFADSVDMTVPDNIEKENILFECKGSAMGMSRNIKLDTIVYVDPVKYYNMPYQDKYKVAGVIGGFNWKMRNTGKHMVLMAPGRIGTSSPELGVPTTFSDISEFDGICEISDSRAGYIVEEVTDYYKETGKFPDEIEMKQRSRHFRDLIAYRIVVSLPKCHVDEGTDRYEEELKYIYEIANALPAFLEQRGFTAEVSNDMKNPSSKLLNPKVVPYYRDYIECPNKYGYKSLHITFFDNESRSYIEVQIRTKEMDDYAEIGTANHAVYEKSQLEERTTRSDIPEGKCIFFDEAYKRGVLLKGLDLSKVEVNMFGAVNNSLINDGCGLYRGRLILPFEHLSRFQTDVID